MTSEFETTPCFRATVKKKNNPITWEDFGQTSSTDRNRNLGQNNQSNWLC